MSPLTPFETLEPGEEKNTAEIIAVIRRKMEKDYAPGSTRRFSHPKQTALLQATFIVEADLPPALRVGVFAQPSRFDAWVRFANSESKPQSDAVKDSRGCAIKLRGAPGQRIAESDEPTTQDFVMISIPTMPLGTVKLFRDATYLSFVWSPLAFVAKMLLTGQGRILKEAQASKTNPSSPADIRYWSTTPYLFGAGQAAKYSLVPTSAFKSRLPATLSDNYLSDNLQQHLAQSDASFDFMVQLRSDPASMPIEDLRRRVARRQGAVRQSGDASDSQAGVPHGGARRTVRSADLLSRACAGGAPPDRRREPGAHADLQGAVGLPPDARQTPQSLIARRTLGLPGACAKCWRGADARRRLGFARARNCRGS